MGRLFGAKLRMKADKECAEWLDKVNAKFGQIIECSDNTEIDLNHELHTLFEESAYQYVFYNEVLCLLNGEGLQDKAERALERLATPLATI